MNSHPPEKSGGQNPAYRPSDLFIKLLLLFGSFGPLFLAQANFNLLLIPWFSAVFDEFSH